MSRELHIDIETYSNTDIKQGVYRYAEDPFFKIQIFGYSFDDKPRKVLDLEQGDVIPPRVIRAILNKKVIKWAHNAQFERVCLSVHIFGSFGKFIDPSGWRCTAVYGSTLGLPRTLEGMGKALGISEDAQKLKSGKKLIQYFSKPCRATKANGGRTRNLPIHDIEGWELYLEYNGQDVVAEKTILKKLRLLYPEFPEVEWLYYEVDQRINDRGIPIDVNYVQKAIALKDKLSAKSARKLVRLTGIESHTKLKQLKEWAADRGVPLKSLDANSKEDLLQDVGFANENPEVWKMVYLLDAAGGTAVAKYNKIIDMMNSDKRLRGQLLFYGAGATGRFAGRGVQVQNLPRVYMKADKLDAKRTRVLDSKRIDINSLTQLIRTSFIAGPDSELAVSDYGQIEARVLAWFANETWALDAFKADKDIYVATAMQMYNLDEKQGKEERQDGKVATLALGYQGGKNALISMGALRAGIPEKRLPELVDKWRQANPRIVDLWKNTEQAVKFVVKNHGNKSATLADGKLKITYKDRILKIWLPSGRALSYYDCHISKNKIKYLGGVKNNGDIWHKDTFGGKLIENIVQATARDILCYALLEAEKQGVKTLFHVHDEIIAEVQKGYNVDDLSRIMTLPGPKWAKGLPLASDGDTIIYYRKV